MEIGNRSVKQSEPTYNILGIDWVGQDQAGRQHSTWKSTVRRMVGEQINNAGQSKDAKIADEYAAPGHLLMDKAPVSEERKSFSR